MNIEKRSFNLDNTEENASDNSMILAGYANPFNSESVVMKTSTGKSFVESFLPNAFKNSLQNREVFALLDHDTSKVLARSSNQTLLLEEDEYGLKFAMDVIDNTLGRDTVASVKRKDINKMSVGFNVVKEQWTKNDNGIPKRLVIEADLFEISLVPMPAFTATDVSVRSVDNEVINVEVPDEVLEKRVSVEPINVSSQVRNRRSVYYSLKNI